MAGKMICYERLSSFPNSDATRLGALAMRDGWDINPKPKKKKTGSSITMWQCPETTKATQRVMMTVVVIYISLVLALICVLLKFAFAWAWTEIVGDFECSSPPRCHS